MIYNPWKIQKIIDDIWYTLHDSIPDRSINKIGDYWLISDTHFNHKKVQEYCGRPDGWQELIINNWNSVVKNEDIVLHLGDFMFGNKKQALEITGMLNGTIFMIKGNHDRHGKAWFEDAGINIIPPFIVKHPDNLDIIYFTHRRIKDENFSGINIHRHVHNTKPFCSVDKQGIFINVSVEKMVYTPIKLSDVMNRVINYTKSLFEENNDMSTIPLSAKTLEKEEWP